MAVAGNPRTPEEVLRKLLKQVKMHLRQVPAKVEFYFQLDEEDALQIRLRAVAREAGVNEVTLFRQFGTKEHLIEAVVGSAFGTSRSAGASHARALSGPNFRADLASFARLYEALLVENLPLVRTMIGEIHRHEECERQALHGIFSPLRAALVERIRRAAREGLLRAPVDPEIAADLFSGMIFSGVLRRAKSLGRPTYRACDFTEACVDVFLTGVSLET